MNARAKTGELDAMRGNPGLDLGSWTPRIAVAPCLNTLPLIDGLVDCGYVRMVRDVPSRLATKLGAGRIDAALLSSIELQRISDALTVLPSSCIGSDGVTMTARIFSRMAPATIRTLHVDPDSRTATALASVLWAECFDRKLQIQTFESVADLIGPHRPQAVLFTGDRVMTCPPVEYGWEIDLGQVWRELTSLPFVFAVWVLRRDVTVSDDTHRSRASTLTRLLRRARETGMARIEEIAALYGSQLGWPPAVAAEYLTEQIQYKFTDEHRKGMETFFKLAHKHGLIDLMRPPSILEP